MQAQAIFINLPVSDIARARAFWSKLGFSFHEQFSNDKALCLILKEGQLYAMLLTHDLFSSFARRPIANPGITQVLLAIEVGSKEQVDLLVKTALENGASRYSEKIDHDWMYYDSFADPDGHQWEVVFFNKTSTSSPEK